MVSTPLSISNDPKRHAPASAATALTGEIVILVVEDDWSTRRFVYGVLKQATKALVMEASGPCEALAKARSTGRPIDLLISDIDLSAPTNGIDLAHEIAAGNPSMKVLLMSGGDFPEAELPLDWRFLAKPFPLAVFLNSVDELCRSDSLA